MSNQEGILGYFKIETGVPIPASRRGGRGRAKLPNPLHIALSSLRSVGDSIRFSLPAGGDMRKFRSKVSLACLVLRKKEEIYYTLRVYDDEQYIRVWRVLPYEVAAYKKKAH